MERIVVKVGSSSLTHNSGLLDLRKIESLVKVISDLANAGYEMILVSSGAVAAGMGVMKMKAKPDRLEEKQAIASVGQCELMFIYDKFFSEYSRHIGQLLLTKRVIKVDSLRENAVNTLNALLSHNVIPIINENDSVATEEFSYGDNDTLAAITARLTNADLLILISDVDGLYDKNPNKYDDAKLIHEVPKVTKKVEAMAGNSDSLVGTGGMITKINAARMVNEYGCDMVIVNGKNMDIIYDVLDGKQVGTRFKAKEK